MEQKTLIFLGPQGCGKGTHVQLLKEYFTTNDPNRSVVHFEAGESLRQFGKEGGYTQDLVDASLKRGELQPDFVTLHLMGALFVSSIHGNEHIIIDGFPRTLEQQAIFHTAMRFYKRTTPTLINMTISDEEAIKRLLKRGRNDDTEAGIRKRLAWTRAQVAPVIEWFRAHPEYRVVDINGEGSIEQVHQEIKTKIGIA